MPTNSRAPNDLMGACPAARRPSGLGGAVKSGVVSLALSETGVGFFVGLGAGCLAGGFTSLIAEKARSEELGTGMELAYTTAEFLGPVLEK